MKIDIGCGSAKKLGFIGLDISKLPGVDIVADIQKNIPLKDNSVEEIYCANVLHHISDWKTALKEMHRVLKVNGILELLVPHFTHNRAYNPFHKHHFSLHCFDYFDPRTELASRRYYYTEGIRFIVKDVRIYIRKSKIFFWTYLIDFIVNLNRRTQHIWESWFCYIFPALNIRFILEKRPSQDKFTKELSSMYGKKIKDDKI